jgi:hypothetical protein
VDELVGGGQVQLSAVVERGKCGRIDRQNEGCPQRADQLGDTSGGPIVGRKRIAGVG